MRYREITNHFWQLYPGNCCHQACMKKAAKIALRRFCAPLGARTLDTLIKSQVLYQLS